MSTGVQPQALSASSILKDSVKNLRGEALGDIKDLMIDLESGRVAYAVLSFGGVLGLGDKLFAVPWASLRLDADEECFVLDVDKKQLEKAPGFDKEHWPQSKDREWQHEVHTFYNTEPYWEKPKHYQG